jgi:hypothetical protein
MHQRTLGDDADAIADEIARCARSCIPLDLEALSILRRLTVADVLTELAEHDLERRRRAAYWLAWDFGMAKTVPQGLLDDAVDRLLSDADPLSVPGESAENKQARLTQAMNRATKEVFAELVTPSPASQGEPDPAEGVPLGHFRKTYVEQA